MVTIIHVKAALKSDDTVRASQLIKSVLRNDPCEEAWYIAARMTGNPSQKMKFVKSALALNPHYQPALRLLQRLENQPVFATTGSHNSQIILALQTWYTGLSTREHRLVMSISSFLIVIILGFVVSSLFFSNSIQLPDVPAFSYVNVNNTQLLRSHFEDNQLTIEWMELQPVPANTNAGQYIMLSISTEARQSYSVQILLYKQLSHLANDAEQIKNFSIDKQINVHQNSVMIYETGLPPHIEDQLINAHLTIPTVEIDPRR